MECGRASAAARWLSVVFLAAAACTPRSVSPNAPRAEGPAAAVAAARSEGRTPQFEWAPLARASFDRARRTGRLVLLVGAPSWCHDCHVGFETTYLDPSIGRLVSSRFVAIRFDPDVRPDLAERYGGFGWPIAVVFDATTRELARVPGLLEPGELSAVLRNPTSKPNRATLASRRQLFGSAAPVEALPWIAHRSARDLDDFFDPAEGSWGMREKTPIAANVLFELRRDEHGVGGALARARLSLHKQRALLDPVWGGLFSASQGASWDSPRWDKRLEVNVAALEALAIAYVRTKDDAYLADIRAIGRWIDGSVTSQSGALFASQDSAVGSHDRSKPFVGGSEYYVLGDADRRAIGIPAVDRRVLARENAMAVAALVASYQATGNADHLAKARRILDVLRRRHVGEDGGVRRYATTTTTVRFLADSAAVGQALVRMHRATGDASALELATLVADALLRDFSMGRAGALRDRTPDGQLVADLAAERQSFDHAVVAARFFAQLAESTGESTYRDQAVRFLCAIATPAALANQGRFIGAFLLALDDVGLYPWPGSIDPDAGVVPNGVPRPRGKLQFRSN